MTSDQSLDPGPGLDLGLKHTRWCRFDSRCPGTVSAADINSRHPDEKDRTILQLLQQKQPSLIGGKKTGPRRPFMGFVLSLKAQCGPGRLENFDFSVLILVHFVGTRKDF